MESSHVFYRRMTYPHPCVVRGEGVYLWDASGRKYIDGSGGAVVVNIGHGVMSVVEAMARQASKVAYAHGTMFTSEAIEAYSRRLASLVPMQDPLFYYLSSGSEAIETALKFARQVQVARGEPRREIFISRWGSYHGTTLGALAVSGKAKMRSMFGPLFRDQSHIPPPYCYRCPFGATYPACDLACGRALEAEVHHHGSGRVVAFIAETVGGATLGAIVPPDGYWPLIAETCDRHGLLLVADEVMVGFGRTGRWFAVEHFGLRPHVMTMGKGASGGYFPLSITSVRREDAEAVREAHGDFIHGGTYSHDAVAAAVGQATLDYLEEHNLVNIAAERGKYLGRRLRQELESVACVGDVRGLGLMWAVEFVSDRKSKAPFPAKSLFARRLCDLAFDQGLILYPGSGSVDGVAGDHVMIAPPFVVTEAQIDEIVDSLKQAILKVSSEM